MQGKIFSELENKKNSQTVKMAFGASIAQLKKTVLFNFLERIKNSRMTQGDGINAKPNVSFKHNIGHF